MESRGSFPSTRQFESLTGGKRLTPSASVCTSAEALTSLTCLSPPGGESRPPLHAPLLHLRRAGCGALRQTGSVTLTGKRTRAHARTHTHLRLLPSPSQPSSPHHFVPFSSPSEVCRHQGEPPRICMITLFTYRFLCAPHFSPRVHRRGWGRIRKKIKTVDIMNAI